MTCFDEILPHQLPLVFEYGGLEFGKRNLNRINTAIETHFYAHLFFDTITLNIALFI
jgi:hypothetical protein